MNQFILDENLKSIFVKKHVFLFVNPLLTKNEIIAYQKIQLCQCRNDFYILLFLFWENAEGTEFLPQTFIIPISTYLLF